MQAVDVRLPSGEVKRAAVAGDGNDRSWTFADTTTSGIFRVERATTRGKEATGLTFAVNVNTAESDLTQVDPDELAADVWPGVNYFHRTNWRDASREVGEEIVVHSRLHLWLLMGALALLLTESCLNWFTGRYAR